MTCIGWSLNQFDVLTGGLKERFINLKMMWYEMSELFQHTGTELLQTICNTYIAATTYISYPVKNMQSFVFCQITFWKYI